MASLKDATDADLSHLRILAAEFNDSLLWSAMRDYLDRNRGYTMRIMENPDTPMEKLKYTQGVLAQASRDILLVARFLEALTKEQERRQRQEERQ